MFNREKIERLSLKINTIQNEITDVINKYEIRLKRMEEKEAHLNHRVRTLEKRIKELEHGQE